jgi:hypothetical protein
MTGVELIAQERHEQIHKHGWSMDGKYLEGELIKGALFAINSVVFEWPYYWLEMYRDKIINKTNQIERLKIAGAFIAAEIDRIQLEESNK